MSGNHSYFALPKYMWISSIFPPFGFLWRYFSNYSSYFFLNFLDFFLFHFIMNFRAFLKLSGQCTWYQLLTSNCPNHLKSAFFCKHYRQKSITKKNDAHWEIRLSNNVWYFYVSLKLLFSNVDSCCFGIKID